MKKLILLACIICSLQVAAQKEDFFKKPKIVYSLPINGLVIYPDTITCPVGVTVIHDLFISGQKVSAKKTVTVSNTNGTYTVDNILTPKSFSIGFFDIVIINNMAVVRITLNKKSSSTWVYKKL